MYLEINQYNIGLSHTRTHTHTLTHTNTHTHTLAEHHHHFGRELTVMSSLSYVNLASQSVYRVYYKTHSLIHNTYTQVHIHTQHKITMKRKM